MKKFSKIMWGTILGIFVLIFIIILMGGNPVLISKGIGYVIPFAFGIQVVIWILGRKKKMINNQAKQTLQNSNYINIVFPQEVTGQYESFAKISLYSLVSYLNNIDKQTMLQNYRQKIQKAMKYRKKHRSYLDAITDKAYQAIKEFNEK